MKSKKSSRDEAIIDVLLKQYGFLRDEITRCIYLEHVAILGLYTFLGLAIVSLLRFNSDIVTNNSIFFLFLLIFAQIIISGFGSLFLKEQARNRRACSFLKAIEYLINEKIGEIGIYWENYITSRLIAEDLKLMDYFRFNISVNPEYYKNRLLSVGLPVFLPNSLVTLAIAYSGRDRNREFIIIPLILYFVISVVMLFSRKEFWFSPLFLFHFMIGFILYFSIVDLMFYKAFGMKSLIFLIFFTISLAITLFWALMISYRSRVPLKEENVPSRKEVLDWLREEESEIMTK